MWKKLYWNSATSICENGNYLVSIMDDSAIACDEVINSYDEEIKAIPTNFNENKVTCKTQSFIFYMHFYQLL